MKKLNLLFTALLLLCCVGTAKAEEVTIDGIKYDVITKAKQAKVINGGSYSGNIVIPSEITYNNVTYSVTSIGNNAFNGCSKLTSITIPNSVTSIGDNAFNGCSKLTSITIPNSVTSIGRFAFDYCNNLKTVINFSNLTFSKRSSDYGYVAYYANKVINAPNGFVEGDFAWFENEDGMTMAGYFGNATELTLSSEYNNKSVTSIGDEAFSGCSGLTSITIPNSVTSIGDEAFADCSGLTSVVIGNGVTSIGYAAFYGCSGLTNITIPNNVTSIGESAFNDCFGLKSVIIGNSVTSIGNNAFNGCSGLTCIEIPNSVTSIGGSAFYSCSGLTSVTIPNSVTSIGDEAFADCSGLTDVYCLATNVPDPRDDWDGDYNPFEGSYPEYMTLHVPAEAINSYKATAPWNTFGNIVALDGEIVEPEEPEVKICTTPTISYNNGKLSFECETEGAEFTTDVTCSDINKFYDSEINFSATYNISVYATATGYDNSDIVNATLCWIECDCNENNNNNIINIPAKAVFVTSNNGTINISYSLEGEVVELYTIDAMYIGSTTIENGTATIQSGLSKGDIAIIKIAEKSIKVILN